MTGTRFEIDPGMLASLARLESTVRGELLCQGIDYDGLPERVQVLILKDHARGTEDELERSRR